jgi:hypothetical protein
MGILFLHHSIGRPRWLCFSLLVPRYSKFFFGVCVSLSLRCSVCCDMMVIIKISDPFLGPCPSGGPQQSPLFPAVAFCSGVDTLARQ